MDIYSSTVSHVFLNSYRLSLYLLPSTVFLKLLLHIRNMQTDSLPPHFIFPSFKIYCFNLL